MSPTSTPTDDRPADTVSRVHPAIYAGGAFVLLVLLAILTAGDSGPLTPIKAIVLGAVEGLTEYLPISSTGHLLVARGLIGLDDPATKSAADAYVVAIQIGAILAVLALYRHRIAQLFAGLIGRDDEGRRILIRLAVAFVPAAVVGLATGDLIQNHLFGFWPVIAAWAVGGAFLLWWDPRPGATGIGQLTTRHALVIGLAQVLALWPGTSRSLVTIAAALALGATMSAAVEFSFLLGLATLTAATFYDLSKDGSAILDTYGWRTPVLGAVVAFVTAVVAVRWLVGFLRTRPLSIFGWYRIGAAVVVSALIAIGAL